MKKSNKIAVSFLTVATVGALFAPTALAAEPDNANTEVEIYQSDQTEGTVHLISVPNLQFKYKGDVRYASTDFTFALDNILTNDNTADDGTDDTPDDLSDDTGSPIGSAGGTIIGNLVVQDSRGYDDIMDAKLGWTVTLRATTPRTNGTAFLPVASLNYATITTANDKFVGNTLIEADKADDAVGILEQASTILTLADVYGPDSDTSGYYEETPNGDATTIFTGQAVVPVGNIYSNITLGDDASEIAGGIYTGALTYTLVENIAPTIKA